MVKQGATKADRFIQKYLDDDCECKCCFEPIKKNRELSFIHEDTSYHLYHRSCLEKWLEKKASNPFVPSHKNCEHIYFKSNMHGLFFSKYRLLEQIQNKMTVCRLFGEEIPSKKNDILKDYVNFFLKKLDCLRPKNKMLVRLCRV